MNHTYKKIFDVIVLIFRLYVGYRFIPFGWEKLMAGQEKWLFLGQQMGNLGIHFAPIFWGLAAAFSEFFGGIALLIGFCTRLAGPLLTFTMLVATIMHIKNNDPWTIYSVPLAWMIGFIAVTLYGAGTYSVDHWLWKKKTTHR